MKNMTLLYSALLMCIPVRCMDLVVPVKLSTFTQGALCYGSLKIVQKMNNLGVFCSNNEPFLSVDSLLLNSEAFINTHNIPLGLQNISDLPLCIILDEDKNIKSKDAILCKLSCGGRVVELQLESDVSQDQYKKILNFFRKKPNYHLAGKQWLLEQKIIEERDGVMIHGTNGYFKGEYRAVNDKLTNQKPFFIRKKTVAFTTVLLLLAAVYACYKNQTMVYGWLKNCRVV